jgi:hypothetical protein
MQVAARKFSDQRTATRSGPLPPSGIVRESDGHDLFPLVNGTMVDGRCQVKFKALGYH